MHHQSCLYDLHISHSRIQPKRHTFNLRHFMFLLDVDEVETGEVPFAELSSGLYEFRQTDYLPDPVHIYSLKQRVTNFLCRHNIHEPSKIKLLSNVRVFGYIFNPISLFYCYGSGGNPLACIAEVGNTFGESKPFLLLPDEYGNFIAKETKFFYVSPFSQVTDSFSFRVGPEDEQIRVVVDTLTAAGKSLSASLVGKRRPLTRGSLLLLTAKYPLSTLRVITLIHMHAFLLWCKKIPYALKEDNASLQRPLFRNHGSIANSFIGDK